MTINAKVGNRKIDYPKLMEHDLCGTNYIFLFDTKNSGTCLKSNNPNFLVGKYYTDIVTNFFYDYHGTLVIENE